MSDWTKEQLTWLAGNTMYEACGAPRPGISFKDCGTLYADGRFEPLAPMKAVRLEEGCRLVGVPSDLYLTDEPSALELGAAARKLR